MTRPRATRPLGAEDPPSEALEVIVSWTEPPEQRPPGVLTWLGVVVCIVAVAHFASLGFAVAIGAGLGLGLPIAAWIRG